MKRSLIVVITTLTLLVGCGNAVQEAESGVEYNSAGTAMENVELAGEESTEEEKTPDETEDINLVKEVVLPDLYYDVFVKYAQQINSASASFDKVLSELQNSSYEVTYTKPTEEDLGMIEVHDGSQFYAYIDFYPNSSGIETIMDVNYGASGIGEVSASDEAHITSVEYSYLIGSRAKVNSLSDLEQYANEIVNK